MSTLPPEIISDILSRLPVKSLLRFRSVSKPWCAQIDGPDFIKLHLAQSIATSSNLSLVAESDGTLYSVNSDSLEKAMKIETPFIDPHKVLLKNACNGLFLLQINDKAFFFDPLGNPLSFILFNPSTRKHFVLPTPPPHAKYTHVGSVEMTNRLGYDAVNDDYKVFNIVLFLGRDSRFIACEARVYSLKSNLWHIIREFAKGVTYNRLWEAYVNGALHVVDCETPRNIVAFDISNESMKLIQVPELTDTNEPIVLADAFDGCLAIICWYPDYRTDIWVMKKYGVKESWSMLLSVQLKKCCRGVMPVIYSKNRAKVLLSHNCKKLVWFDLRKKNVRDFRVPGFPIRFDLEVCVESLVSVDSFGRIDEKTQHVEKKIMEKKVKKRDGGSISEQNHRFDSLEVLQRERISVRMEKVAGREGQDEMDDFLSKGFKLKL